MDLVIVFVLGLCWGSFLNVCIYRLPLSKSVIMPRSYCPECKHPIAWYDNIPLISFLFLRGKCRHCRQKINIVYFITEIITAAMILILYIKFSSLKLFFCYSLLFSGFIVATFTDIKHRIIPDEINLGLLGAGLLCSAVFPSLHHASSFFPGFLRSFLGMVVGGGSIFLLGAFGNFLFKKESMGAGDIKFFAMAGSFIGWKLIILAFFIAPFFGSVFGIIRKIFYKEEYIPYGPFLSIGCVIAVFFGEDILRWLFLNPLLILN